MRQKEKQPRDRQKVEKSARIAFNIPTKRQKKVEKRAKQKEQS